MRAAVGSQLGRRVSYPIAASDIRRWAVAVYYPEEPPRQFWDEEYASKTHYGGLVAPEEFNPFAWMVAEHEEFAAGQIDHAAPDRTEQLLGIPGPGLGFQLNGGIEVEYRTRMRPGDVITSIEHLADYSERSSRLGLMLVTVLEEDWSNQDGFVVKRNRRTLLRY